MSRHGPMVTPRPCRAVARQLAKGQTFMPTTVNKGWFKPGHRAMGAAVAGYPRKGPPRLSARQHRARQAKLIAGLLTQMYEAQRLGSPIDANAVVRLVNTHARLLAELDLPR
jgi:hypothetical protein